MKASATQGAAIEKIAGGWRLEIGRGDSSHYQNAQLDDYFHLPRYRFPHDSLTLSLRARASHNSILGTWGFGLWNDPFGLSLGFGGNPLRLPALPNAVWFFHASPHNYLSFTDDKPAQGFLAQTFRSSKFHPLLMWAGLAFPFSRRASRKLLSKIIMEDGINLVEEVTRWHRYQFEWSRQRVTFWVDQLRVFESSVSPHSPLGIIIWIDNQYAAFTPAGKIGFGVLENSEPAWIEVCDLQIN